MKSKILIVIGLMAFLLSACAQTDQATKEPGNQSASIQTLSAATIRAMSTEIVAAGQAAQTATFEAFLHATATPDSIPSEIPVIPTAAEFIPTAALEFPTETPVYQVQSNCNLAAFVDENIPDGSQFYPGEAFTKSWTLKNAGTCSWTKDYSLVFVSGSQLTNNSAFPITDTTVEPGQSVTISLPLNAPDKPGSYRANFKLRTAEGLLFAFPAAEIPLWLEIQVRGDNINLSDSYCSATWESPSGELHCPGQPNDRGGYVYSDNRPILEDGYQDDETALWMGLYNANDAWLMGTFPAMNIPEGGKFTAILGCRRGNISCDVEFSLNYVGGNGDLIELGNWHKIYDGGFQELNLDLSRAGGKQVRLVLLLKANGSPSGDEIHLLQPTIKR